MSITHWRDQRCTQGSGSVQDSNSAALEKEVSSSLSWSNRVFELSDLQVNREPKDNLYFLTFLMEPLDTENSGKTKIPVPPVQLSFKAEGKEVALFSGLLSRHCLIQEFKHTRLVSQSRMLQELQDLRAENQDLRHEIQNLYGALESLQRPRVV